MKHFAAPTKSERHAPARGLFLSCAEGAACGIVAGLVLLLLFCAIASAVYDPAPLLLPLSLCALYLGSLGGGIAAVRLSGDGLMSGLIAGLMTSAVVWLLSCLPLPGGGFPASASAIFLALIPTASVLGAILGHKKEKKPRRKR